MSALETLKTFDESSLPDLDVVVLGALELFETVELPDIDFTRFRAPLVLGSGNAEVTGRILFQDHDAMYADESSYRRALLQARDGIRHAVIISASGKKHSVELAENLHSRHIKTWLITNNAQAPAREFIPDDNVLLFPRNREPYTYNTSTYLGPILSKTREDAASIRTFVEEMVAPKIPDTLGTYDAFYMTIPARFVHIRDMLVTKFDELFGARVSGRVYTLEQTKHAKTVVPHERECFISFGEENTHFGAPEHRIYIPIPDTADYGAMIAIAYYVVGHIQKQHPPHFKERIGDYVTHASELFGQKINVIVE